MEELCNGSNTIVVAAIDVLPAAAQLVVKAASVVGACFGIRSCGIEWFWSNYANRSSM